MRESSVATMTSSSDLACLASLHDVLDERLARDEGERFAGEPCRGVPGGNNANDIHGP